MTEGRTDGGSCLPTSVTLIPQLGAFCAQCWVLDKDVMWALPHSLASFPAPQRRLLVPMESAAVDTLVESPSIKEG